MGRRPSAVVVAGFALAVALTFLFRPSAARACAGPCPVPLLFGVAQFAEERVVITNFGLLARVGSGYRLTCEERIGGLISKAVGAEHAGYVSTGVGLFVSDGDLCSWQTGASSARNEWLLDFESPAVSDEPVVFALVQDPETFELTVESATGTEDFTVLHSFSSDTGYRELRAGSARRLFVAGYRFEPREFWLAHSDDGGTSWLEDAPPLDNAYASFRLERVDPTDPDAVFLVAETVAGTGQELWRFDAESREPSLLLELADGELFGGLAFSGDDVWVAGRRRGAGSLYRADRAELAFERVEAETPPLECLAVDQGELLGCVNDFTYGSEFVLGRSSDGGRTWEPELTLQDLGQVESCGDDCRSTTDALHATFGTLSSPDAGVAPDAAPGPLPREREPGRSGFCSASPERSAGRLSAWFIVLLLFALRRVGGGQWRSLA